MTIEEAVSKRLQELIDEAESLRQGDENGQTADDQHVQRCSGWLVSALNAVQILCPNETNAFRKRAEKIAARDSGWVNPLCRFGCQLLRFTAAVIPVGNGALFGERCTLDKCGDDCIFFFGL